MSQKQIFDESDINDDCIESTERKACRWKDREFDFNKYLVYGDINTCFVS